MLARITLLKVGQFMQNLKCKVIDIQPYIKYQLIVYKHITKKKPRKTAMTEWRKEDFNTVKGLNDDHMI